MTEVVISLDSQEIVSLLHLTAQASHLAESDERDQSDTTMEAFYCKIKHDMNRLNRKLKLAIGRLNEEEA